MIDVEPFIVSGLNALVPAPGNGSADWADVRRRAGNRPPRRRLVLALAFVGAAVFVAIAIADSFGGFSGWLTGEPGKPAPPAVQQAFAKGIRSWAGFPSGTELRQLAQTTVGGATYTLYGFRGGSALCLRLEVTGSQTARDLVCPPLAQLRASPDPALVAVSDYGVGVGKATPSTLPFPVYEPQPPAARVTFGIVADGLRQVELAHSDGKTTQAIVSGDAFLSVDTQPSISEHVTRVWALAGGKRIAIPFTSQPQPFSPTTPTAPRLTLHGPTKVQRVVHGGGIRWLARRQPEGIPVPKGVHHVIGTSKSVIFAREITPNPAAPERLIVSVLPNRRGAHLLNKLLVCVDVVGGRYANSGGGCWPAGQMFSAAPFTSGTGEGDSQYVTVAGLASDEVARLELYLGTGQREAVPLHDNGYLIEAPSVDEPLRLVAYDNHGLVIGTEPVRGGVYFIIGGPVRAQPVAKAHWQRIVKNSAGQVFVAPGTNGAICYAIASRGRPATISCGPKPPADSVSVGVSSNNKQGATLDFRTGSGIARVTVHYRNGHTQTLPATGGIVFARIPASDETQSFFHGVTAVTGFDSSGRVVAAENLLRTTGGSGMIGKLTSSSISVGQTSCQITPSSPSVTGYRTGLHVQYLCDEGVLSLIGRSKPGHLWANRSVLSRGSITSLTTTALTIDDTLQPTPGTSAPLTCTLTATSPALGKYHVGEQVQIFCVSGKLTGINKT